MIAKGKTGRGFKGAAQYLLHDKDANTAERVAWTHTENLRTDHPQRAWREMVWTAGQAEALKRETGQKRTGRKADKPVYHLSLSWAKDEAPTREQMIATGKAALKTLGLERHQALVVCHTDEPQPHIHLLVNRVDHETGLMNTLSRSNRKLSAWAIVPGPRSLLKGTVVLDPLGTADLALRKLVLHRPGRELAVTARDSMCSG